MRGWLSGLAGLGLLMLPATAHAVDPSVGVDLYTTYVWRGITIQDTPVLQPWLDVSGIPLGQSVSLGVNVWSSIPLKDKTQDGVMTVDSGAFSEFDAMLTLSLPKGFKAGYIEYVFPTTRGTNALATRELFAGWAASFGIDVTANAYYDFGVVDSFYGSIGIGRSLTLSPKATLTFEAQGGVAGKGFAEAYGGTQAGFFNYGLSARLGFAPMKRVSLAASIGYAGSIDKKVLPKQPAGLFGGVTVRVGL